MQDVEGFKLYKLSNIVVMFLPPNTTAHIQPLDQGIIAAFKAQYRRYLVHWAIAEFDKPENKDADLSKMKPDFLQMLTWSKKACKPSLPNWDAVTQVTISNCWWKTGMFPELPEPVSRKVRQQRGYLKMPLNHDEIIIEDEMVMEGPINRPVGCDQDDDAIVVVMELGEDIEKLRKAAKIPVEGLIDGVDYTFHFGEENNEEELSDVALVELVMSANAPTLVDPDDDDVPLEAPSTTHHDVIEMLAHIKEWMEWSNDATATDIDSVDALHATLHRRYVARLKQSEIPFERKEKKM